VAVAITELERPLTVEDLECFPDDGNRYEILQGELLVSPAPSPKHGRLSVALIVALDQFISSHGGGEIFHAPVDVVLSPNDTVQPDVCFVSTTRRGIVGERWIEGAPDLVVEIISPSSHQMDLVRKRALYAQAGVPEYWIVDPDQRAIFVLALENAAYILANNQDGKVNSQALAGFSLDPVSLFAVLDN
jgi:Uma2 family endonuclease